ncbi:hypothetical protein K491DRAFT_783913 [Lophiostoma macrostomum CBS 122681]|uniref:Nicotinamide N-methyltransferase n=1 Tax=Lophiostoma macrostomum CBS 122681 TaxID=1314788 RepID=A0A6A6SQJ7_9PLEO|nr:hypothetical protein K491DRAFT_783913 [Lophiostoma macrostomum CBS 122681]
MFLPNLISLRHPDDYPLSPEDIFSSSFGGALPNDIQNQHGDDPDTIIVYHSRKYGDIELRTADVNGEEERRKFAHYLWNAGVLMAELIGGRPSTSEMAENLVEEDGADDQEWWIGEAEGTLWSVRGETVLELGAGVGLAGIISALSGAERVSASDYPAPAILNTIETNISKNIPGTLKKAIKVEGHEWGILNTDFASENKHRFTRILAADCFWMPHQHENLARSMSHFLSKSPTARVLCISGFHTGRARLALFFEEVAPEAGLEVELIFEMDADGMRREWQAERDGGKEDVGERKKWLVLAQLRRAGQM